jgi:predicted porin
LENFSMKKTLIALAAVAVSTAAMAQVTVSGKYAVAYTSAETAAGVKSNGFGTTDGDIVFTAMEDIGGGLKAGASLAIKVRGRDSAVTAKSTFNDAEGNDVTEEVIDDEDLSLNTSLSGAASSTVGGRDASVFLQGGFGRITLGTVEAGNGIIGRASAGAPVIGQDNGVTLDGGTNVDLASLTLPVGDFTATLMMIDSIGAPGTGGMQSAAVTQDATLIGLAYAKGPISAGLDITNFGRNGAADTGTDSRTRLSASYDLGVAKLGFGYQTKETFAGVADKQTMVGVSVPMGAITLGATFASRNNDDNTKDADGYEIGANYAFSKRTNLQAAYLSQKEDVSGMEATTMRVRLMHSF